MAIASLLVSGLLLFASFLCLPTIVLSPSTFVMCFTFSMIALITAMAFWYGPRLYVKKLFIATNRYASLLLISSMLLALYFSLINPKYVLSLLFCLLELNAVVFYFFNTTAISL